MIDRHQPALHESSNVESDCHIPMVASEVTDEQSLSTRRAVHRPPPSTRPITLDYGLQVHICILARLRPPSASLNSLDYGLEVYLQTRSITASKCISKHARSRSRSVYLCSLDHGLQGYLQTSLMTATKCISPNSLDHGHQVLISQLALSWPPSASLSLVGRHFPAHLELLSSTACSQSRYTVCRWVAI